MIACTHTPPEPVKEIVYKTKIVLLEPPAALLIKGKLVPPPNRTEYLAMSPQERENAWTDIYILQNKTIALCNRNLSDIDSWVIKQRDVYKENTQVK